jgi:hypothetical protein
MDPPLPQPTLQRTDMFRCSHGSLTCTKRSQKGGWGNRPNPLGSGGRAWTPLPPPDDPEGTLHGLAVYILGGPRWRWRKLN